MPGTRAIWLAGALTLAAGCATTSGAISGATTGDGRPPIALTVPAVDGGPRHLVAPPEADRSDPAAVAAEFVRDGLNDQGLSVIGIDTELIEGRGDAARVQVAVVHSTGRGHPHQSLYTVDLERAGTGWQATGFTETAG